MNAKENKAKKTSQALLYSNNPIVKEKVAKARAVFENVDMALLETLSEKKAS